MEYRLLGRSGLKVSVYSFGTMTFGGTGWFAGVGQTKTETARRQIDMCLEAGVNLFDTADVYSNGESEEILADALGDRRQREYHDKDPQIQQYRAKGRGPKAYGNGMGAHQKQNGLVKQIEREGRARHVF